ncbi:MAG: hypothetical protein NVSMB1_13770 [Polyangiales bacterium]
MHALVFETSIGFIGVGFTDHGLARLNLPILGDADGGNARALLLRQGFSLPEAPSPSPQSSPHPNRGRRGGGRGDRGVLSLARSSGGVKPPPAGSVNQCPQPSAPLTNTITPALRTRRDWISRIVAHLDGTDVSFDDLPIDLSLVSVFARKVYFAARAIPPGQTVTYGALGDTIGAKSARAIGVALGKNPIALVVPCHRVVGANDCGGFSAPGGTATKATLLAIEGGALGDAEHRFARRHLARVDPALATYVRATPCTLPIRPKGALFRTLVRAIAGQQLSTKAAATIFGRLEAVIDEGVHPSSDDPAKNSWDTRAPARILSLPIETLRGVGLSTAKALSVRDLATKVLDGSLVLEKLRRAPDERVINALVSVRGIGRWTAEMLLIFELGRPDVLPVDDLGIRKGAQKVWKLRALPSAEALNKRAESWRPFRSIGSWYLWRALDG